MTARLEAPDLPDWLAAQVRFTRYRIELADGIRVHVMEQGEGYPVLLFHGNPAWGYLYRKVVADLADAPFRLIMPDLPGFGFSDRVLSEQVTLARHVAWMADLIGQFGLTEVVAVVHDWGGPIGLGALSRHPSLMRGLVVMNTAVGPPRPGFRPSLFHRVFSTRLVGGLSTRFGLVEKNMGRAQADRRSISGVVRDSYLYPLREQGNQSVIDLVRMTPDTMDHASVPLLEEVGEFITNFDGPAAIVWGENDPVLGRLLRRVNRALPQARVTVTPAGHYVPEEAPGEVAAAIRSVTG